MARHSQETRLETQPKIASVTMHKNIEKKEDGRLLIFYSFTEGVRDSDHTPALMPGCIEECGGGGNPHRTDLKDLAGNAEVSLEPDD